MAENEERNASPPAHHCAAPRGDRIGTTVFSKRALFASLLTLSQEYCLQSSNCVYGDGAEELEEEMEADLCRIWDMTLDEEVAEYISSIDGLLDIFLTAARATNKPRLTELLAGILANVCCVENIRMTLSSHSQLRDFAFSLLNCRDTPTLIQTSRLLTLISTMPSDRCWSEQWTASFKNYEAVNDIQFILNSSENAELLLQSSKLLHNLSHFADAANIFDTNNLFDIFTAILNGLKEALNKKLFETCSFLLISLALLTSNQQEFPAKIPEAIMLRICCLAQSTLNSVLNIDPMDLDVYHILTGDSVLFLLNCNIQRLNDDTSVVENLSDSIRRLYLIASEMKRTANGQNAEMGQQCDQCLKTIVQLSRLFIGRFSHVKNVNESLKFIALSLESD